MAKDSNRDGYPVPIVDQSSRPGTIARLIVFIAVLTAAAVVFSLFRDRLGEPFLLGMLGILAMIGVGYLFATAIGFVQVAPRSTSDELSKAFVDSMTQGVIVTDRRGRVVYANKAYGDMTGASSVCRRRSGRGRGRDPAGIVSGSAPSAFPRSASRYLRGNWPTYRRSGRSRSASSATCSRRSTISTTHRPASSPPIQTGA